MADAERVLETCRNVIRKKSIRIHEFFVDFDRLRSGLVHPNQFVSALGIAGIDQHLSDDGLQTLKERYVVQEEGSADKIDYKTFCRDVDAQSAVGSCLQKTASRKSLTSEEQDRLCDILADISEKCRKKGILVKPMFVDFANSNNSTKLVGHVTQQQFHRTLDVKLGIRMAEEEVSLLCKKYRHPDYKEMVDYVAFAHEIMPDEKPYNPYTEA